MANQPGRRRLILCRICFKADCPLSRWIEESGDMLDALDMLREGYFERLHDEMDKIAASQLTVEEKRERITEAIAQVEEETGEKVDIDNLAELLGVEVKLETDKLTIEKDSLLNDILTKNAEFIERAQEAKKKGIHE